MKRVVHANRGAELLRITEVNVGPQKFWLMDNLDRSLKLPVAGKISGIRTPNWAGIYLSATHRDKTYSAIHPLPPPLFRW